jgi:hypothetical protein
MSGILHVRICGGPAGNCWLYLEADCGLWREFRVLRTSKVFTKFPLECSKIPQRLKNSLANDKDDQIKWIVF